MSGTKHKNTNNRIIKKWTYRYRLKKRKWNKISEIGHLKESSINWTFALTRSKQVFISLNKELYYVWFTDKIPIVYLKNDILKKESIIFFFAADLLTLQEKHMWNKSPSTMVPFHLKSQYRWVSRHGTSNQKLAENKWKAISSNIFQATCNAKVSAAMKGPQ